MKRFISIILSIIICATFFLSACENSQISLLEFVADVSDVDYEGYQCYFLHKEQSFEEGTGIFTYDKTTTQGEALLKRIKDIKDQINVEVIFDDSYDEDTYQVAAMSDLVKADIVSLVYMNAMQMLALGGFFHPINEFPDYIDLSDTEKYGDANTLEPVMIDSVPYAVQPLFWVGYQPVDSYVIAYNTDVLAVNGIADFHEFYENETWTWETFENEYLAKLQVPKGDGLLPAISTNEAGFFDMMIYSNDVHFVTKNNAGETVSNTFPERFVTAYDKTREWMAKYPTIDTQNGWVEVKKFLNEETAATLARGDTLTRGDIAYKSSSFSYNIMPFPCGPDAEYGKWANFIQSATGGTAISRASEEPEIAAHTLSLLFEPFEELGGRDGLYDYYDTTTFIDETDTKIFFDVMQYARYDYTFWNQTDVGRDMASKFGESAKQGLSAAEAYERYRHYIEEMVYDYVLPNYDYMYDNYYSEQGQ